jgi:hypothetical protein
VIVNLLLEVPFDAKSGDLILSIICCRYISNLFSNLVKTFSFIYVWNPFLVVNLSWYPPAKIKIKGLNNLMLSSFNSTLFMIKNCLYFKSKSSPTYNLIKSLFSGVFWVVLYSLYVNVLPVENFVNPSQTCKLISLGFPNVILIKLSLVKISFVIDFKLSSCIVLIEL